MGTMRTKGSSRGSAAMAAALILGVSAAALATPVRTSTFTGESAKDGELLRSSWRAWVDVEVDQIEEAMTHCVGNRALLEDATSFRVERHTGDVCVFTFERASPTPLIPDASFTVEARWSARPDGSAVMRWTLVEGAVDALTSTWVFRPEGAGTWVTHEARVDLGFNIPSALLGDPAENLKHEVARFRRHVGATTMKPRTP